MNYKKTMAATAMALGLLVAPLSGEAAQFTDVPANASYKKSVEQLVNYRVLDGYRDGTFKPHALVTRAQAASIMAKALALDLNNVQAPGFKDVAKSNGHYAAIAKLTELGVFSKTEKFNPNSPITRVQMAKMLVMAFDLQSERVQTFKDVAKTSWYYETVGILGALQITRNSEKFEPAGLVSRAHFATFIERVITLKRSDEVADKWDTWTKWDERGDTTPKAMPVEQVTQPTPTVSVNEEKSVKDTVQRLKSVTAAVADAREDVEDVRKDLQKALDRERQKAVDEAKKELGEALQLLDKQLVIANELLVQTEGVADTELDKMKAQLQSEIRRATKVSVESYAETFDKDYQQERLEDVADDLEGAVKDAKKGLEQKSFNQLQGAHKELTKQLQQAEAARQSYKDSNVKALKELDDELAEAMHEAEDVQEQVEEWFEDRLSMQLDHFEDLFKDALRDLEDAIDDGKKGKIFDAKEKIEGIIDNAQRVVDDYKELTFDGIQKDLTKLQKEIADAKKDVRDADE